MKPILFCVLILLLLTGCCLWKEHGVEKPYIKVDGEVVNSFIFEESISLEMETQTQGADIYFTIDGTDPSESNYFYMGRMMQKGLTYTINDDTDLRIVAIKAGFADSLLFKETISIKNPGQVNLKPVEGTENKNFSIRYFTRRIDGKNPQLIENNGTIITLKDFEATSLKYKYFNIAYGQVDQQEGFIKYPDSDAHIYHFSVNGENLENGDTVYGETINTFHFSGRVIDFMGDTVPNPEKYYFDNDGNITHCFIFIEYAETDFFLVESTARKIVFETGGVRHVVQYTETFGLKYGE